VEAQHRDTGQPKAIIAAEEVAVGADQVRFFAGAARRLDGIASGEYLDGLTSSVRREPIGVVAQVTPWNYPLMMAIWKIAPALAAGNTIVLKPSDTTPESTLVLASLTRDVLPDGVFNVVLGDASTGRALVEHPVPGLVAITGSVRAGVAVATSAADRVARVHLELGGKAPAVVWLSVQTLEARAYGTPLASSSASSAVRNDCTVSTGPKTSACTTASSCRTPVTIVGAKWNPVSPTRCPPVATTACSGRSSTTAWTAAKWRALLRGP
jgi:betaine-aldehyde dehydrogenase